ncbi:MAG: C40 family peptidase [Bacteroidota bacterium]
MKKVCNNIYLVLIILLIGSIACTSKNNSSLADEIQNKLDSLKSVHAPDKRVALWTVSLSNEEGKISVLGEVDSDKAYNDIKIIVSQRFPNAELNIDLLPKEGNEPVVNGLVNNSVINLRSNPRHSAEIATQTLLGTPVRILKRENGWYLVQTPNKYIAWVDAAALVKINKEELDKYREAKKIVYNKQYGFSYSEADCNSQTISDLVIGCILPVTSSNAEFYKVQYPDKRFAWIKKDEVIDFEELINRTIDEEELVKTAKKFLGIPYLWGGTSSKAIDCSGFTSTIYYMNGIILQRDASQQTKYGELITTSYSWENLQTGDLLFYGRPASDTLPEKVTHVAMYIGDSEFIHASGKVRINSIDSTRDNFITDYVQKFIRATQVKGSENTSGIEQFKDNNFYKTIISE